MVICLHIIYIWAQSVVFNLFEVATPYSVTNNVFIGNRKLLSILILNNDYYVVK